MSIASRYKRFEELFCAEAKRDGAAYLRYRIPKEPVDFILVGMEPSTGGDERLEEAPGSVSKGVNFSRSRLDFILHYCAQKYLCRWTGTYFMTDVSKGRMPVTRADEDREGRYERWRPLLIEEINLLAKKGRKTKVIAIGTKVDRQLRKITDELDAEYMGWVIHYSGQWPGARGRAADANPGGYSRFKISTNGEEGRHFSGEGSARRSGDADRGASQSDREAGSEEPVGVGAEVGLHLPARLKAGAKGQAVAAVVGERPDRRSSSDTDAHPFDFALLVVSMTGPLPYLLRLLWRFFTPLIQYRSPFSTQT